MQQIALDSFGLFFELLGLLRIDITGDGAGLKFLRRLWLVQRQTNNRSPLLASSAKDSKNRGHIPGDLFNTAVLVLLQEILSTKSGSWEKLVSSVFLSPFSLTNDGIGLGIAGCCRIENLEENIKTMNDLFMLISCSSRLVAAEDDEMLALGMGTFEIITRSALVKGATAVQPAPHAGSYYVTTDGGSRQYFGGNLTILGMVVEVLL